MITTFWIIAAILILVALAFVIPPFFKKSPLPHQIDRKTLNVAIYKERLAELALENLTPAQREVAKQDLDSTLWQELNNEENRLSHSPPRAQWASLLVAIFIPVIAVGGYWQLGSPELIIPPVEKTHEGQTNKALPANFKEMVDKLAARLEKQPEDENGWRMLARSYVFLADYPQALKTYNQILVKYGEQPEVLTELAEFIAKNNHDELAGLPTILLKTALTVDPNYPDALWLAGFSAAQQEDFNSAIGYWQRFQAQLPATDTETQQAVEKQIAEARQQLVNKTEVTSAKPANSVSANSSDSEKPSVVPMTATAQSVSTEENENDKKVSADGKLAIKEAKIEVKVSLDPALQEKVNPQDTLFVYARATQGPPMPVAIVKKTAKELPTVVILDDSVGLIPNQKLSQFTEVTVLARISKTGQATPQSGDLLGQSASVSVDNAISVEIVINQVVP